MTDETNMREAPTMSLFATELDCLRARDKYFQAIIAQSQQRIAELEAERQQNAIEGQSALDEANNEIIRLREKLAAQQAYINKIQRCADCYVDPMQLDPQEELTAIKAAEYRLGEINGYAKGLSDGKQAGREELEKELMEQEPVGVVRMSSPPDGNPKPIPKWILSADQSHLKNGDMLYAKPFPQQKPLTE